MGMNYLIFNGIGTSTPPGTIPNVLCNTQMTDVYVSKMPSHKKAAMRNTEYYVKGRDGALHIDEGYADFDLTVQLILLQATVQRRYEVNAWADGTGRLVSSDDIYFSGGSLIAKAYMASVKDEVVWDRLQGNGRVFYDTATITFKCKPFMVEAVESQITMTGTQSIINPGSAISYPLLRVTGSGDATFSVNGSEIGIDDMSSTTPVYIDCETGYVYTEEDGATAMRGNIPHFEMGTNTITFGNNVTKIIVTPRWRWI